ncbi:MAG: reductive dehalogenase [Dehalococcoidaceae bacterium]|nr:reductive dehalogenase [Dehalococcoidaceae bacterium]
MSSNKARYHSTISRRDFMKALGLGGISLGAAGLSPVIGPPAFADLDEVMASPLAAFKRPSWVKPAEKPTIEIEWKDVKRFDYHNVMWAAGLRRALGNEQYSLSFAAGAANRKLWIMENKPGSRLQDVAIKNANHWAPISFLGPQSSPTPESLGVPRYEGSPEENARLVTTFLRMHGASHVGFAQLETGTTENLIYAYDTGAGEAQGPRLDILDVDAPEENLEEGYRVIPKKARWVIVYTMRMAHEFMKRPTTEVGDRSHYYMYNLKSLLQGQVQNFLRTLGYMCLGEASQFNALGVHTGFGVMAGLGETCRIGHIITPEYGIQQRVQMLITDLPLPPGQPVDFGVMNFCRTCKKCAEYCPAQAINHDTEPRWDNGGEFYRATGIKRWWLNEPKCRAYIAMVNGCATCFAVCPYSHTSKASWNGFMRSTVSANPALNGFFRKADDFFYGSGISHDPNAIWDQGHSPWGYD